LAALVTGPPPIDYYFKIRLLGVSGSPLSSVAFWPAHLKVKVVEVRIIQITAMLKDSAGWQRSHLDLLAILDNVAERLMFDQAIAKINDPVFEVGCDIVYADIRAAKLPHAASVEPFQRRIIFFFFGDEDNRVMAWNCGSRIKYLLFPSRRLPPAKHEGIVDRASSVIEQMGD
ncbi:MAG: hypothetical protein ACK5OB_00845, partial [Pirellula sp.]